MIIWYWLLKFPIQFLILWGTIGLIVLIFMIAFWIDQIMH
jgi:hypothetical protein